MEAFQLVLDSLQGSKVGQAVVTQSLSTSATSPGSAESQACFRTHQATISTSLYRQTSHMPPVVPTSGSIVSSDSFQQLQHQVRLLPGQQASIDLDKNISQSAFTQVMRCIQPGVHVSFNITIDDNDCTSSVRHEGKSSREQNIQNQFERQLDSHRKSVKPEA